MSLITSIHLNFAIEGVEKSKDSAKHNFYSSNRHDPCGEVLCTEKRLDHLDTACWRQKRAYSKHNTEYWSEEITARRSESPKFYHLNIFLFFFNRLFSKPP